MRLTLVRHATLLIDIAGVRVLIDPAFDAAGTQPPIDETPNPRPNPLVGLPAEPATLIAGVDAVIVTHLHQDHLDATAGNLIRGLPVYCQPWDVPRLAAAGIWRERPPCLRKGSWPRLPASSRRSAQIGPAHALRGSDSPSVRLRGQTTLGCGVVSATARARNRPNAAAPGNVRCRPSG